MQQPRLVSSLPCSSLSISGGEVTLIVSGENWSTGIKRSSFSLCEKMADWIHRSSYSFLLLLTDWLQPRWTFSFCRHGFAALVLIKSFQGDEAVHALEFCKNYFVLVYRLNGDFVWKRFQTLSKRSIHIARLTKLLVAVQEYLSKCLI